jgi:hypothetical protein
MKTKCGAMWAYWGKAEEFGGMFHMVKRLGGVPKAADAREPGGRGSGAGRGGEKAMSNRNKQYPSPTNSYNIALVIVH